MTWWNRRSAVAPKEGLRWVSKSQRHLSAALAERGFIAGQKLVGRLLKRRIRSHRLGAGQPV